MTEKRFKISKWTTHWQEIMDNGTILTQNQVVDLLNEQHDRIKWLEERVSQLECLLELDKLHKEVENGKKDKFVRWRCE